MKVYAYTWPWNTGKTTAIEWGGDLIWVKDTIIDNGRDVIYFPEIARNMFELLEYDEEWEVSNTTNFQKEIRKAEQERLFILDETLDSNSDDVVLIDRTYHDNVLYNKRNRNMWLSTLSDDKFKDFSHELYDTIILFTEPRKNNRRMSYYNDDLFNTMFNNWIIERYWKTNEIKIFKNNSDDHYINWKMKTFWL